MIAIENGIYYKVNKYKINPKNNEVKIIEKEKISQRQALEILGGVYD